NVKKSKKLGSKERLASPRTSKPRTCLRWLLIGRIFDLKGKLIESSDSECKSDTSACDNASASNPQEPTSKQFLNSTSFLGSNSGLWRSSMGEHLDYTGLFLERVDLLKGNRSTNLYTINLHEMTSTSLIYLMARATLTKSWPMRFESINGKQYVLVIVDDYSRYTWVHFLISKDEAPEVIKTFLKKIQVLLQAPVIIVRTDNGTNSQIKNLKLILKRLASLTKRQLLKPLSKTG
ncbi:retrovirus-related pol polyprotein from transposon TNT 1-94, partial [Tanacetum coccineum]